MFYTVMSRAGRSKAEDRGQAVEEKAVLEVGPRSARRAIGEKVSEATCRMTLIERALDGGPIDWRR